MPAFIESNMTGVPQKIRVLSLNGGGARGMFTISVLAELEKILEQTTGRSDVHIGEYFDLIAGTSIGGILAMGLAKGKSARELKTVFKDRAGGIFPEGGSKSHAAFRRAKSVYDTLMTLRRPRYKSEPLRDVVVDMLGESTVFKDLKSRVVVTSVNLTKGSAEFFKTPHRSTFTRDGERRLVDAAMATSAAPTFFAPHRFSATYYADGGLVANNPSFVAIQEVLQDMQEDFPEARVEDIQILNVGTMGTGYTLSPTALASNHQGGYYTLWGAGKELLFVTMASNEAHHQFMLKRALRAEGAEDNLIVLDDIPVNEASGQISLDNASEEALQYLESHATRLVHTQFSQDQRLKALFDQPANPFKPFPKT